MRESKDSIKIVLLCIIIMIFILFLGILFNIIQVKEISYVINKYACKKEVHLKWNTEF